jgi:hypothetical protein
MGDEDLYATSSAATEVGTKVAYSLGVPFAQVQLLEFPNPFTMPTVQQIAASAPSQIGWPLAREITEAAPVVPCRGDHLAPDR